MHTFLKFLMLIMLLIMFLATLLPAFFTKARKGAKNPRNVIIIDSANSEKLQRYLAYAESLVKDQTIANNEVILVALGDGINVLDVGGKLAFRVEKLMQKGIQAYICDASWHKSSRQFVLLPNIKHVENGTDFAESLMDSGYVNQFA